MTSSSNQSFSVKPHRRALVTFRLVWTTLGSLLFFLILNSFLTAFHWSPAVYLGAAFFLIAIYNFFEYRAQYKKSEYLFGPSRIVARTGGLFWDNQTELLYKNITHVGMEHPFLEHSFYKTGHISLESAGQMEAEVVMTSVENPEKVRQRVIEILREKGFSLSREEVRDTKRPNSLCVAFTSLIGTLVAMIIPAFFLSIFLGLYELEIEKLNMGALLWYFILFEGYILYFSFRKWGEEHNRTYTIYGDTVKDRTDFFRKKEVLIPMENLSDVTLIQNIITRILGVYSLQISCKGTGSEVELRYIHGGERSREILNETIDHLRTISETREAQKEAPTTKEGESLRPTGEEFSSDEPQPEGTVSPEEDQEEKSSEKEKVSPLDQISPSLLKKRGPGTSPESFEKEFTAQFKMISHAAYAPAYICLALALVSFILTFPAGLLISDSEGIFAIGMVSGALFLLVAGIAAIPAWINSKHTTYSLGSESFRKDFQFLHKESVEFTTEKVTAITVTESYIQRFFGAVSVHFHSIGTSRPLTFEHVDKEKWLTPILAKEGIRPQAPVSGEKPKYSLLDFTLAHLFVNFCIVATGLFLGFHQPFFLYLYLPLCCFFLFFVHHYYKNAELNFYPEYIRYQVGFLYWSTYYVRYEEVKNLRAQKYPLRSRGVLTFEFAGASIGHEQQQNQYALASKFKVHFLKDPFEISPLVDGVITGDLPPGHLSQIRRGEKAPPIKREKYASRPHLGQSMVVWGILWVVMVGVAFFAMWAGLEGNSMTSSTSLIREFFIIGILAFSILYFATVVLFIKSQAYILEERRLVFQYGIIYKEQKSINYAHMDNISQMRGALNKIFKTGHVNISTVSSSGVEMSIASISDYREFYNRLQGEYQEAKQI